MCQWPKIFIAATLHIALMLGTAAAQESGTNDSVSNPNVLMANAVELYREAEVSSGQERQTLLRQVGELLGRIRSDFPESVPAQFMNDGKPLGPIDMAAVSAASEATYLDDLPQTTISSVFKITGQACSSLAVEHCEQELAEALFEYITILAFDLERAGNVEQLKWLFSNPGQFSDNLARVNAFDDLMSDEVFRNDFVTRVNSRIMADLGVEIAADLAFSLLTGVVSETLAQHYEAQGYQEAADFTRAWMEPMVDISLLLQGASSASTTGAGVGAALVWAKNTYAFWQLGEKQFRAEQTGATADRRLELLAAEIDSYSRTLISGQLTGVAFEGNEGAPLTKRHAEVIKSVLEDHYEMQQYWLSSDDAVLLETFDAVLQAARAFYETVGRMAEPTPLDAADSSGALPADLQDLGLQPAPDGFLEPPMPNTPSESEFVMGKWSIQEEPDFRLQAGEQSGGFEISKEGQVSFLGTQIFGDYRTSGEWPSLAVFINKKQTRAMALAMDDGAERFALVDLEERKVLNDKPLPFWMYGPADTVIWDPSGQFVALSMPMAEYSKGLGVFELETGQYATVPSREFNANANDYWLPDSLYTDDSGKVSISVALQRFNADGSPVRSDNTPPQKRTLDFADLFVNVSRADSIQFVFPKEELDRVATLSNDGELRSTGFNVDISDRLSVNCTHWVTQGAGAASEYGITTWQALLPKLQCNIWSDNDDGSSGLVPNIEVSAMLANDGAMIVKLADAEYFHNKRQGNLGQCAFSIQNQVYDYKKDWLAECPSESTVSPTRIEPADLDVVQPLNCEPVSQAGFPQSWMNRKLAGQTATGSSWALHLWAPGSSFGVAEFTNAKGKTTDGFWRPTSTGICQSYNGRQSWVCHDVLMCTTQNDRFVLRNEQGDLTSLVSTTASNDTATPTNVAPITNGASASLIGRFGSDEYHETSCEIGPVVVSQSKVLLYESSCQLKRPIPDGASSHVSDVMCSGEGDTWPDRFTLSVTNQNTLSVMSNNRSTPSLYRRCATSILSQAGDQNSSQNSGRQKNHLDSATLASTRVHGVYDSGGGSMLVRLEETSDETLVGLFRAFGAKPSRTKTYYTDISQFEAKRRQKEDEERIEAARALFQGKRVVVEVFEHPINLNEYDFQSLTFFACGIGNAHLLSDPKFRRNERGGTRSMYLKPYFPDSSYKNIGIRLQSRCKGPFWQRGDTRVSQREPYLLRRFGVPNMRIGRKFLTRIPESHAELFDIANRNGLVRMSYVCEMFPASQQTGTHIVNSDNSGTCSVLSAEIVAHSPVDSGKIRARYKVAGGSLVGPEIRDERF